MFTSRCQVLAETRRRCAAAAAFSSSSSASASRHYLFADVLLRRSAGVEEDGKVSQKRVGTWKCVAEAGEFSRGACTLPRPTYAERLERLVVGFSLSSVSLAAAAAAFSSSSSASASSFTSSASDNNSSSQSAPRTIRQIPDRPQRTTASACGRLCCVAHS